MIDLKRCPFCGGMAEWEYAPIYTDSRSSSSAVPWYGRVMCAKCRIAMFGSDREETEMSWNTMVSDDTASAMISSDLISVEGVMRIVRGRP